MKFNTLFFMLILSSLCLALAQVSFDDCCLKYVKRLNKGTKKHVMKYREQKTDGGCNIPAIIFTMRRGRLLCANPKESWVKDLMNQIDKKNSLKQPKQQQSQNGRG